MMRDIDWAEFGIWYLVFLFSTTLHEAAHAWVAHRGGDDTAASSGHLTLDPFVHIRRSPFGMVLIPIITFVQMNFLMGWASVPFNPRWGQQYPRRQALMSLAGPMANFALAVLGLVIAQVLVATDLAQVPLLVDFSHLIEPSGRVEAGSALGAITLGVSVLINLNVLLGVFNLLPLPPLDGAGVVEGFFPKRLGPLYESMRGAPLMQFVTLIAAWQILPYLVGPSFSLVIQLVRIVS